MDEIAQILQMEEIRSRAAADVLSGRAGIVQGGSADEQPHTSRATGRPDLIDVLAEKLEDENVRRALARWLSGR